MGIFSNKKEKELRADLREANEIITELREVILDNDVKVSKIKLEAREDLVNLRQYTNEQIKEKEAEHKVIVADLNRTIESFENDFDSKLEKAVKDERRSLEKTEKAVVKEAEVKLKKLEKEFETKTKKLEADFAQKTKQQTKEHLEKLARMDTKLEQDKASYRKYVRQENNKTIENLEKENKALVIENAKLLGANAVLESSREYFAGKQEGLMDVNDTLGDAIENLTNSLPKISANYTTPEINIQVPSQPQQSKGGNNGGGEQKK